MQGKGGWLVLLGGMAWTGPVHAADLADGFSDAATEFAVPEALLLALAYEASRWDPTVTSQWGGYGLFDLREPGEGTGGGGPDIEVAAALLGVSPDDLIDDPASQIRAAAALLAQAARYTTEDGSLPDATSPIDWKDAVRAFSGRHEPNLQQLYADYVFSLLADGVADDGSGLSIPAHALSLGDYTTPPPPPGTCDYSGCYQFVAASSSNYSNYSRGASDISYIVIHTVQGSYSGCISWFQNSSASVSAHYVVRSSDGQVTQMVDEEDVAWHAGNWSYNLASVGIEHEGYVDAPSTWYTPAMYASSGLLSADIAARNGIAISRSYIIGHNEVPGATHTDPGSGWDWDTYMDYVSGNGGTGDLIGVIAAEDIYNGARLTNATVWIEETGERTTSDEEGYYRFYDLPLESYTIRAIADGYAEGSCSKGLAVGDNWCSIALQIAPDDPDPSDTGDPDPADTGDTGGAEADPDPDPGPVAQATPRGSAPGAAVRLDELWGCAAVPSGTGLLGLGLAALGLGRRRRRR